jgi:hypothetical protein
MKNMKNDIEMVKSEKQNKKAVMREKIMKMPTLDLKGNQIVPDFKQGKKVKLEVEGELLKEVKGIDKWSMAEGEKSENYQTVLIKNIKVISDKE